MSICREAGGVWADGTTCGMDTSPGQRCDWHTEGAASALAVAVSMGMVDQSQGRFVGHPPDGYPGKLIPEAIARMVAVQSDPANHDEFARLLGLIAEDFRHRWALWDLVTAPGTDATIAQADEHRGHLHRLRAELGPRLTAACLRAMLEIYRYTPGKAWPYPTIRHRCEQPDSSPDRTCDCPTLYDWEWSEQQARAEGGA